MHARGACGSDTDGVLVGGQVVVQAGWAEGEAECGCLVAWVDQWEGQPESMMEAGLR